MLSNSVLLAVLPALAIAANDWSKSCTSGTCSYESGDGKNSAWSNLVINSASTDVLSDITSAAGWEILNCDSKSTDPQDIRLVCVDQAKECSHLFNGGAENTIVRLPENCSGGPFARIARTWVDKDQSLPDRLAKRGQTSGQVRGLALDFDFSQIPESRGKVYITAAATNSPAQRDAMRPAAVKRSLQPIRHANRRAQAGAVVRDFTSAPIKRSPFSFGDAFKKVTSPVSSVVDKGIDIVKSAPKKVVDVAKEVPKKVVDVAKEVPKKVVDVAKEVPKKVIDVAKDTPKKVVDTAKKVVDVAKEVPKKIEQAATEAPKKIKETAKKVANKAKKVGSKVESKLEDGAKKAVDKAKSLGESVAEGAEHVEEKAVNATKKLANGAEKQIGKIIDSGTGAVEDVVDSVGDLNEFDKTFNKDFDLINVNKNFPIIDQSISCPQKGKLPAIEAGVKMDVDVAAKLTANVGFIVTGSIVPPEIEKLAFTGGLTGDVTATFNVNANAKGTFKTPDVKLFEVGLPGLDFPGILAVGPSFTINANAKAELGIVADISVTASISLPKMHFTFPESEGKSSAKVDPKDAPIKLDVGASATLTGRAEAHLIPRLDIGVKILNGAAKATVFANVDASAALNFSLDAKTSGTPVNGTAGDPSVDFKNFDSSFGGSVGMDLGVAINVGAEAALKPFFDQTANFQVFQKTFPVFEKKFGDQARKRSVLTLDDGRVSKRALTCPGAGEGAPKNKVVDAVADGS